MGLEDLTGNSKYIDALDDTNPAGSADAVSEGDNHLRGIKNVLLNSFPNVTGEVSVGQDHLNDTAPIPSGTKMVFYQASAPTGWTQDTNVNDRVLQVTDGNGGGTGGQWTISGIGQGNLSVDGHQLTNAEMPSHNHGGSTGGNGGHSHNVEVNGNRITDGQGGASNEEGLNTGDGILGNYFVTDSVGNHSHSISTNGSDNAHSHGLSGSPSHDGNWRPSRIDVIVATRD